MQNLLENLENNEAVLLMYLAQELPAEDHAEVDLMLARDPALRAELAALVELQDQTAAALALLDTALIAPLKVETAAHLMARAVSQWHVRRLLVSPPVVKRPRIATWAYPAAIAAVVLMSVGIWWIHTPGSNPAIVVSNTVAPAVSPVEQPEQHEQAQRLAQSLDDSDDATRLLIASNREDTFAFVGAPDSGK